MYLSFVRLRFHRIPIIRPNPPFTHPRQGNREVALDHYATVSHRFIARITGRGAGYNNTVLWPIRFGQRNFRIARDSAGEHVRVIQSVFLDRF